MTAARLLKVYYPLDGRTTAFVPRYRPPFNPVSPAAILVDPSRSGRIETGPIRIEVGSALTSGNTCCIPDLL